MLNGKTNPLAVILTAISVEYQAARAYVEGLRRVKHRGSIYQQGTFQHEKFTWDIVLVETDAGNINAALAAERAISYFDPIIIIFVGVAGGLKDVRLGDVVAATKVYGYESGKANTTFLARPDVGNSSFHMVELAKAEGREKDWLERIKGIPPGRDPKVYVKPIAAGEKVVDSTRSETFTFLTTHYSDAIAVEMEGRGFLQAVYQNRQVDALIIRGISDLIEEKKKTDAANWQDTAARYASAFAFEILAKWYIEPQQIHEGTSPSTFLQEPLTEEKRQDNTSSQHQFIASPERPLNRLLDEFLAALPEHYKKIEIIFDFFEAGESISFSRFTLATNALLELQELIRQVSSNSSMLKLFDEVRLVDIQVQITQLLASLQAFNKLRPPKKLTQKRVFNRLREDARTKCKLLLESLKQFH